MSTFYCPGWEKGHRTLTLTQPWLGSVPQPHSCLWTDFKLTLPIVA